MPPSEIYVENFTVSALKEIYALEYENPYFKKSVINYSPLLMNTGIANMIKEHYYNKYCNSS